MRRLGVHTSIAGGLHLSLKRAKHLGCNTVQIFSHNPRGWLKRRIEENEIGQFRRYSELFGIRPIFIHSSYLINLASPDIETRKKSIDLLSYEMKIANILCVDYIVLHPGRAAGQDVRVAARMASEALSMTCEKVDGKRVGILLENTAGHKGDISSTMPLISEIIDASEAGCVRGICLDTCHAYAAGYDIANIEGLKALEREIKEYISPLRVELIHLNDSKRAFSSNVDRHYHIGKGEIGLSGFRQFLSFPFFKNVPLILETPVDSEGDDKRNLQRVRKIFMEID